MNTRLHITLTLALIVPAQVQTILFDFENAPIHTSLPISLTVGGETAHFTATGAGYSIQPANSVGVLPVGFSGLALYPNSIYGSDLLVSFSAPLTNFSILYAPQELACDSSATMRVTAYMNSAMVGTATTNAQPGTWPSETLQFNSTQRFNSVVVHYDHGPVTGGDWGPIFTADNMYVSLAPPPVVPINLVVLPDRSFQFAFTNLSGGTFTVLTSTNLATPLTNWTVAGSVTETSAGCYQFRHPQAATQTRCFYIVQGP